MGQPDQVNAGAELSTVLRQWWQGEEVVLKQDSVVGKLRSHGIEITQATLSRYLDPAKPSIAREEVVRALHAIFQRPPEDLALALGLWARATTERTARNRTPETPPAEPGPALAPPLAPGRPARGRRHGLAAAALVLLGAGALWLAAPWESARHSDDDAPAAATRSAGALAVCEGEACTGLEPNYTVCRNDAVTAFVDADTVIGVELRYSPRCKAAWARISQTHPGDIARITDLEGRTQKRAQISGHTAHSWMLPAAHPRDVTACAVLAARTICANIPTSAAR
ncbi:DUF2690 domain-containing protein [Streptomyces sp. NBC_00209]|uniref:DUF2690 domain-containing protein n=1 Tax=Streptomyces sp. NBC_00209 TaxID=2975682 RepID=UPI00325085F0